MFLLFMSIWAAAIALLIGVAVYRAKAKARVMRAHDAVIQSVVNANSVADIPDEKSDEVVRSGQVSNNHIVKSLKRDYLELMYARAAQAAVQKDDFDSFILSKYVQALEDFGGKAPIRPTDNQREQKEIVGAYLVLISQGRAQAPRGGGTRLLIPKM